MSGSMDNRSIRCRKARASFRAQADRLSATERAALDMHLDGCSRCAREYRLYALGRAALDAAGSSETITPDKAFFVALRARIERGPAEPALTPTSRNGDESWAGILSLAARQLIPAMAMLLALIIGATFVWNDRPQTGEFALRPSEIVVIGEQYDAGPTSDDVLETLVAVEDGENGR